MGGTIVPDEVLSRLRERLAREMRLEALILFGSRARGAAAGDSDYDLVVVSPDFDGVPFLQRGRLLLACREPGRSYDFLCYTPREFEELANQATLVREAAETGVWLAGDARKWRRVSSGRVRRAG